MQNLWLLPLNWMPCLLALQQTTMQSSKLLPPASVVACCTAATLRGMLFPAYHAFMASRHSTLKGNNIPAAAPSFGHLVQNGDATGSSER